MVASLNTIVAWSMFMGHFMSVNKKKSYLGSKSESCIKTCSVNVAFKTHEEEEVQLTLYH